MAFLWEYTLFCAFFFFYGMGLLLLSGKERLDWGLDCVCGCIEEDLCSGHWVGFVTDGIRSSSLLISTLLCFFVCVFACFFCSCHGLFSRCCSSVHTPFCSCFLFLFSSGSVTHTNIHTETHTHTHMKLVMTLKLSLRLLF
jgi:hypothetical protein